MRTKDSFLAAYRAMIGAAQSIGIPEETARMIANQLHSEIGLQRMTSYLINAHPRSMEEVADEMIAIMEDRQNWIRKKQAEESNARLTEWYNSDMRGNDE